MSATIAPAVLAIATAFFDSLWQGVLIAGAVWLGLRCLPKMGAATRYAIWLCALASIVLVPLLTVALSQQQPSQPAADAAVTTDQSVVAVAPVAQPRINTPPAASEPAGVTSETSRAVPHKSRITISQTLGLAVALIWMLVAGARGLLLLLDVRALAAIRRNAWLWSSAHDYPVYLSDRVHVPLAAGFLHPAIILPASLLQRLPADGVQTIVIHEVAHLRRYDVWTNALARVAEAFAALNPVAWFVMRRISMEREIACDDWVVARTGAGDAFAQALAALAQSAGARVPLAAPSALGSRHFIVVRIERLLDSAPRRLRLSPPALGGALMLLALIAFTVQSISPVLAFEPPTAIVAQASTAAPAAADCPVPNRGILMAFLLGPRRRTRMTPADNTEILDAQKVVARVGSAKVATFELTVDAAGKPRNVTVISPRDSGTVDAITHIYMASTYAPALRNCEPVTTTIRTAIPLAPPEASTVAVVVPEYPAGWSDRNKGACKVPTVSHSRSRPGFAPPTTYGKMLPAFPDSMKDIPVGSKFETSLRVHVDAAGAATSAAVVNSSGKQAFDDAALAAARTATYPLTASTCKPRPTDYVWHTTFERNSLLFRLGKAAAMRPVQR